MGFKVTDHSKEVLQELNKKVENALKICGMSAEGYAKDLCPHKTGLLRNSITYALSGENPAISSYTDDDHNKSGSYSGTMGSKSENAVYIGTNVEYAPYIEHGSGINYKNGRRTSWTYKDKKGTHMTGGRKAQPFLKPAIANHVDYYKKVIKGELSK